MSRPVQTLAIGFLVIVAAVASAGVVLALDDGSPSNQLTTTERPSETITVSTAGEARVQPDAAVLRVTVEATDPDVSVARTAVAENVSDVRSALAETGLDDGQMHTSEYRIYEDRRPDPRSTDDVRPTEYRVRQTLTIELNDTDRIGTVIDVSVDAGATGVQNVQYTLSAETRQTVKNRALQNAMADARSQAETVATSGNLTIDGVRSVDIGNAGSPRPVYVQQTAAGGADTDIDPGPVTIATHVTVTYDVSG